MRSGWILACVICMSLSMNNWHISGQTETTVIHITCLVEFPEIASQNNIILDDHNCITLTLFGRINFLTRHAQQYALAFDYDSAIGDMDGAIELAEANDVFGDARPSILLYTLI
ncbi:MAG: hypothetical protein Q9P01_15645, partial [Anaerolineae bacterium]|nr:hypothetical protein [Anaerolineae bacterium]